MAFQSVAPAIRSMSEPDEKAAVVTRILEIIHEALSSDTIFTKR